MSYSYFKLFYSIYFVSYILIIFILKLNHWTQKGYYVRMKWMLIHWIYSFEIHRYLRSLPPLNFFMLSSLEMHLIPVIIHLGKTVKTKNSNMLNASEIRMKSLTETNYIQVFHTTRTVSVNSRRQKKIFKNCIDFAQNVIDIKISTHFLLHQNSFTTVLSIHLWFLFILPNVILVSIFWAFDFRTYLYLFPEIY